MLVAQEEIFLLEVQSAETIKLQVAMLVKELI